MSCKLNGECMKHKICMYFRMLKVDLTDMKKQPTEFSLWGKPDREYNDGSTRYTSVL